MVQVMLNRQYNDRNQKLTVLGVILFDVGQYMSDELFKQRAFMSKLKKYKDVESIHKINTSTNRGCIAIYCFQIIAFCLNIRIKLVIDYTPPTVDKIRTLITEILDGSRYVSSIMVSCRLVSVYSSILLEQAISNSTTQSDHL